MLNTGVSGTAIKDEDDMSSNSASHLATQQSIKAYVDSSVAGVPTGDITSVVAGTGLTGGGTSGAVTLNVIGGTGITANADDIAIDSTVTTLTGSQTLTNKTLTSPVLNTGVSGTAIKDEDDLSSNSATHLATQQSIKAYVDTQVAGGGAGNLSTVLAIGNTTAGNKIVFGDSTSSSDDRLVFGADSDLQIYHDSSHSRIDDSGTGSLLIQTNGNNIQLNKGTSENMLVANVDDSVELYFNNVKKFETTVSGVDVTGTVTADGLTVDGDAKISGGSPTLRLTETDQTNLNTRITAGGGSLYIQTENDAENSRTNRIQISHSTGDISFFEDTGTTPKLFWDASAESLGIGTSSPTFASGGGVQLVNSGFTSFRATSASNTGVDFAQFTDGVGYVYNRDNAGLIFGTNSADRMTIAADGNVGISDTTPENKLTVVEDGTNVAVVKARTSASDGRVSYQIGNDADNWFMGIDGGNSDSFFISDVVSSSDRLVIDTSGNVGIGTTPQSFAKLQVKTDTDKHIAMFTNAVGATIGGITDTGGSAALRIAGAPLIMTGGGGAGSEHMRIDASGNLLVGTTNSTPGIGDTDDGAVLGAAGWGFFSKTYSSADTSGVLYVGRNGTDGNIINIAKDGTTVGSIGTASTVTYIMLYPSTGFRGGGSEIIPATTNGAASDAAKSLGSSSYRFHTGYFSNGVSSSSDQNEKQDIAELTSTELAVSKRLAKTFRTYRRIDSVEEKGDNARTHTGTIAQQVHAAFAAEGLDAAKYGMYMSNTWTNDDGNEQTRLMIRYEQLLSFISAGAEQRLTDIETRLAALEG